MKSRKNLILVLGVFALIAVLGSGLSVFSRVSAPARNFEFTYVTKIPPLPAGSKASKIWIPLPQSDAYQSISALKIESPFAYSTRSDSEYGNEYAYLEAPAASLSAPAEVSITFQVARQEHLVVLGGNPSATNVRTLAEPRSGELRRFLEPD